MILSRIGQLCACAAEAGVSNDQEAGCGEETFLAEDDRGGGEEWDVDSGVLPAAQVEGESVLLVAAQAQGGSAGSHDAKPRDERQAASFALVSDEPGATDAGIELVLGDGRRLRIRKGVDEETLRAVLARISHKK